MDMMKDLPYDLDRYFVKTDDTIEVPLTELLPGIAHAVHAANRLMAKAYRGECDRRAPIGIIPRARGGYNVVDGNSTLANAIKYGWPTIYAVVLESANA